MAALATVHDPEIGRSITDLNMVSAVDLTDARTEIPGQSTQNGQSLRLSYSKILPDTDTSLTLATYLHMLLGEMVRLRSEQVIPVCSPRLKEELAPARPEDLRAAPLLHLATRPDAWESWFAANDVAAEGVHGMLLDQFAMVAQAAIAGLGLALLPDFLIEEELARGTLVAALDRPLRSEGAYWLVWPVDRADHPPLAAFRGWLVGEAAEG